MLQPFGVQAGGGHAVESAVVAFPQPAVVVNRDAGATVGDICGLDGAGEVGDQHGGEVVVAAAPAEFGGEPPTLVGQRPGKPAGRDPGFVVRADRVGLVDDLDAHRVLTGAMVPVLTVLLPPGPMRGHVMRDGT
jgi:hypothetical protein